MWLVWSSLDLISWRDLILLRVCNAIDTSNGRCCWSIFPPSLVDLSHPHRSFMRWLNVNCLLWSIRHSCRPVEHTRAIGFWPKHLTRILKCWSRLIWGQGHPIEGEKNCRFGQSWPTVSCFFALSIPCMCHIFFVLDLQVSPLSTSGRNIGRSWRYWSIMIFDIYRRHMHKIVVWFGHFGGILLEGQADHQSHSLFILWLHCLLPPDDSCEEVSQHWRQRNQIQTLPSKFLSIQCWSIESFPL